MKKAGAPSVRVRPLREASSGDAPSCTPYDGVLRVWSGAVPGTHPRERHTSPPSGERHAEAREWPAPAPAGGPRHPSVGGFPHLHLHMRRQQC